MNNLQIFKNEEFGEIRTLTINNEPYFVGKDVAEVLGYANSKDAIQKHVDDEDKQIIQRSQFATLEIPNRGLTIINESGLYSLILSSKLSTAKKFKRWVTSEVLPNIRKHGNYIVNSQPIELGNQMLNLAQGTQIMAQVVQGMLGTVNSLQVFVQDSIQAKDKQIDDIANLVGMRSKNICSLTGVLKKVIATKYGVFNVNSSMDIYKRAKNKVFKEFNVHKWEDIPVGKYNRVQAFIEECI